MNVAYWRAVGDGGWGIPYNSRCRLIYGKGSGCLYAVEVKSIERGHRNEGNLYGMIACGKNITHL